MPTHTPHNTAINQPNSHTDVLIIGAGLAGLSTALSLPKQLQITILAKQDVMTCSSSYAQGGIAAVVDKDDNISEHVSDTLIAGDGLCDKQASTAILSQGSEAIAWLVAKGVPFTTEMTDGGKSKRLHLTQEGGHGRRRVVHADDATGKHIMQTLQQKVSVADNITVLPYHEALNLLTVQKTGQKDAQTHCTGAMVLDVANQNIIELKADAVVLASGGLGQLFSRATAPDVCVGDGIMMAWEAGCRLANLEFVQFHPTGLVAGNSNFLISEAVRGEGGQLRCPILGERFMPSYDKRAELAPRDIVARAISEQIAKNGLGYVHLDISHQPADFIRQHFPDIYAHCLSLGIDITQAPIPVAPTAHYTCGGVVTTVNGLTDVAGLYAAGEVAHTGLHGANRLASNSLLECVVVGQKIANHIPKYLNAIKINASNNACKDSSDNKTQWQKPIIKQVLPVDVDKIDTATSVNHSHLTKEPSTITIASINDLKTLMTTHMGIRRSESQLLQAIEQVKYWQRHLNLQDMSSIESFRLNRLLTLASLLLQSALARTESRGGHYRNDYPKLDSTPAISVVYLHKASAYSNGNEVNKANKALASHNEPLATPSPTVITAYHHDKVDRAITPTETA